MFKNEDIKIATNHLKLSQEEIAKCADSVYSSLEKIGEKIGQNEEELHELVLNAINALQFQDIITQRLQKVANFLEKIDTIVDIKSSKEFLEEFAWENEVDQDDIDKMFKEG